jgi:hypothetical protein
VPGLVEQDFLAIWIFPATRLSLISFRLVSELLAEGLADEPIFFEELQN